MSEIVERLEPPLKSVVGATWYRTLGINSIHTGIDQIKKFVKAPDNPFGGELKKYWEGKAYEVWMWKDINISKPGAENPIIFDSWIFGNGRNVTFVRKWFWTLHLGATIEKALGLKKGTLKLLPLRKKT